MDNNTSAPSPQTPNTPTPDSPPAQSPTDNIQPGQSAPIKISYGEKLDSEVKQAEISLRDMSNKMPLSVAGIAGIFCGVAGLFVFRFWFGLLALILAIVARKYQNDLAGFYLGFALAVIDFIIFIVLFFLFSFTQANFWV